MQGSGESSQSFWTTWDTQSTSCTRYPTHDVKVAWTRVKNSGVGFATIGSSVIGGTDIIGGQLQIITEPDKFEYYDETERVLMMMFDRRVDEPLSGMAYSLGDVIFDNTTKRFSWGVSDTIGTALKPRRPIKMFMGFKIEDVKRFVPVMYGLTDKLSDNRSDRTFKVSAFDYVSYINDYELESSMYTDQRSDQIIADILSDVGFTADQYELEEGLNTIGFAWFEKGTKAGDAIRRICEAEEGYFYQDEQGLLRFLNRRHYAEAPYNTSVWTINPEDMLSFERVKDVQIINRCTVKAKPREVQTIKEIYRSGVAIEVPAGGSATEWADFKDPVTSITDPVATTDYTANTSLDGSGSDGTSDISIVTTKFARSAKMVITNASGTKLYVDYLRLRGTPAVVTSQVNEIFTDSDSEENYGRHQLEIKNDFIDSNDFAYYLARAIVRKYKTPLKRYQVEIPANPSLQLKDRITVVHPDTESSDDYRIMRIQGTMSPTNGMTQKLTIREITGIETDCPAIIGTSTIGGECVIWT